MSELSEKLLAQERALTLSSFTNADALALGLAAVETVKFNYRRQGVAVHVERNREVIFSHLMDGASANNLAWVLRKKNVVDLYGHSSLYVGEDSREHGRVLAMLYPPCDYQAEGGSFPILIAGVGMVGTLTVSGLVSSVDHAVCVTALEQLIEKKRV